MFLTLNPEAFSIIFISLIWQLLKVISSNQYSELTSLDYNRQKIEKYPTKTI